MYKIGVFDSGIGGFSILKELFRQIPNSEFYYYCDEAHAPYGNKTDDYILQRSIHIVDELLRKNVNLIVIACNTATAASIDTLRMQYPDTLFVGVEPYLNAYSKEHLENAKIAVLTTESMGNSPRFKKLKAKFDPNENITLFPLKTLARGIDDYYFKKINEKDFNELIKNELSPIKDKGYTHAILGCTHYPLVKDKIENYLQIKTLSPCPFVATRVKELLSHSDSAQTIQKLETLSADIDQTSQVNNNVNLLNNKRNSLYFYSSENSKWVIVEKFNNLDLFENPPKFHRLFRNQN